MELFLVENRPNSGRLVMMMVVVVIFVMVMMMMVVFSNETAPVSTVRWIHGVGVVRLERVHEQG